MIDIETEVFSIVSAEVRKKYPKIYMTGEYVKSPPSLVSLSLRQTIKFIETLEIPGVSKTTHRCFTRSMSTLTKRVVRRLNVKQSSLSLIPRWKHSVSHEPL